MSIPSARLHRVLSRLIDCYRLPDAIRLDNGLEMISDAFAEWAAAKSIRAATSNRANAIRMPSLSGSIAPKCSMHTYSPTSSRFLWPVDYTNRWVPTAGAIFTSVKSLLSLSLANVPLTGCLRKGSVAHGNYFASFPL